MVLLLLDLCLRCTVSLQRIGPFGPAAMMPRPRRCQTEQNIGMFNNTEQPCLIGSTHVEEILVFGIDAEAYRYLLVLLGRNSAGS
jgi:hypothetical protein